MSIAKNPTIGFIGLGYVGLTFAAVLANKGYRVIGIDIDSKKVKLINRGLSPLHENKLDYYISSSVKNGFLLASTDYRSLEQADIIFVTVPTPTYPNGKLDVKYLDEAFTKLAEIVRRKNTFTLINIKSTVLPGTTRSLAKRLEEQSGKKLGLDFSVTANPEFLREGSAVDDVLRPYRVIIGKLDEKGGKMLQDFWKSFYSGIGIDPPILNVSAETAELIKYASNVFLACKISYINSIARICEHLPECDILDVAKGMGLDPRIGPYYLKAGLGYGGSCLPKDTKALIYFTDELGEDSTLFKSIHKINETQILRVIDFLENKLGSLKDKQITILGIAFKPGTDDIRESRGLKIAEMLVRKGAKVILHDPNESVLRKVRIKIKEKLIIVRDLKEALRDSDAVIIATDWPEYKHIKPENYEELMKRPLVFDGRRIYDPKLFIEKVEYYAVGLGQTNL